MIAESLRSYYLKQLGVPVWYATQALPGASPDRLLSASTLSQARGSECVRNFAAPASTEARKVEIAPAKTTNNEARSISAALLKNSSTEIKIVQPEEKLKQSADSDSSPSVYASSSLHWLWWVLNDKLFVSQYSGGYSSMVETQLLRQIGEFFGVISGVELKVAEFVWPIFANRNLPKLTLTELSLLFLRTLGNTVDLARITTVVAMGEPVAAMLMNETSCVYGKYKDRYVGVDFSCDVYCTLPLSRVLENPRQKLELWRQLKEVFDKGVVDR